MSMMLALAFGAADAAPTTTDFTVGGLKFRVAIPAGFCLPQGEQITQAAQIAAGDPANITNVMLIECGVQSPALPELVAIKTLRMYATTPLQRETFIAQIAAALPTIETPDAQQKLLQQTSGSIASATGTKVDLKGALRGQGRDATCAYIGGSIDVTFAGKQATGVIGACATVVGSRQFSVYRVSYKPQSDGGAGLLTETRKIALTIKPLADK
ncbi:MULTISPECIES: hypothetical protein [Sphingomonas]|uniref:hypothetical protein n=1 Tax=Sphingomonas TaxID=13687 RepID=UPI000829EB55|nr:hypothetical protein [Sphingomonas sp. CCH10-B3]